MQAMTSYREKQLNEVREGLANSTLKNYRQLSIAAGVKYGQIMDFIHNRATVLNAETLDKVRAAFASHCHDAPARVADVLDFPATEPKKSVEDTDLYKDAKLSVQAVAIEHKIWLSSQSITEIAHQLHDEIQNLHQQGHTDEKPGILAAKSIMKQKGYL